MNDNVKPDLRYDNNGTRWFPTEEYKHAILLDFAKTYNLRQFVETGTHHCWTLDAVYRQFDWSYSIELGDDYYNSAVEKLGHIINVNLIHGDSSVELPRLLKDLNRIPTLFYLDAHFSGGGTVGQNQLPLQAELRAIFQSGFDGIIVIDDCVPYWQDGIPEVAAATVAEYPEWQQEIKHGLMRVWRPDWI